MPVSSQLEIPHKISIYLQSFRLQPTMLNNLSNFLLHLLQSEEQSRLAIRPLLPLSLAPPHRFHLPQCKMVRSIQSPRPLKPLPESTRRLLKPRLPRTYLSSALLPHRHQLSTTSQSFLDPLLDLDNLPVLLLLLLGSLLWRTSFDSLN